MNSASEITVIINDYYDVSVGYLCRFRGSDIYIIRFIFTFSLLKSSVQLSAFIKRFRDCTSGD